MEPAPGSRPSRRPLRDVIGLALGLVVVSGCVAATAVTGEEAGRQVGSTLTQQYVKNLRLARADSPDEREQAEEASYRRKVQEARHALQLSRTTSKDAILEGYLNLVFFGDGAYGVQAAAERYVDVDAVDLTLPQAALLAGLVKNPTALEPTAHPDAALERRNVVLDRMLELGSIDGAAHAAATAAPQTWRRRWACAAATGAPAAGALLHPRHERGEPAGDGRRVRRVRRAGQPLPAAHGHRCRAGGPRRGRRSGGAAGEDGEGRGARLPPGTQPEGGRHRHGGAGGGYRYPLRDVRVGAVTYPQVYGGGVPAQTWSALVREALRGTPPRSFPRVR